LSKARLLLAVVVTGVLVAGCGSSDGESQEQQSGLNQEERVRAVGKQFFDSLIAGKYGRACDLLTEEARKQLEDLGIQSEELKATSCEDILGLTAEASGPKELRRQVGKPAEWKVEVEDDRATIKTAGQLESAGTELVQINGEWLIGTQPSESG
jgi:hypothetical protein